MTAGTAPSVTVPLFLGHGVTVWCHCLVSLYPAGIILEAVSEPIRQYLRTRKDTIRCIMTMLTEEPAPNASAPDASLNPLGAPMCLLEEAAAAASSELALHADWQPLGEAHELSADEAQAALEAAEMWEPDSVEADPGALSRQRRTMDIVRLLVAIFGTQVRAACHCKALRHCKALCHYKALCPCRALSAQVTAGCLRHCKAPCRCKALYHCEALSTSSQRSFSPRWALHVTVLPCVTVPHWVAPLGHLRLPC